MSKSGLFISVLFLTTLLSAQDDLLISEFLARNDLQLQDEDGDYSDWIEIYNPNAFGVSLSGWSVTDDDNDYTKWTFPDSIIGANQYLLVFASGKDRNSALDRLHTNFKLSGEGEFLALVKPGGSEPSSIFTTAYPVQYSDVSYGLYHGEYLYLQNPTPGAKNDSNTYTIPPEFNVQHGHFYDPFLLELSADYNASIYYTLDASTPDITNGTLYSGPIQIDSTTVVRAIAVKEGLSYSASVTQSYIFPGDVITQPRYPEGYPPVWLQPVRDTDDHIPIDSDYGMSSTIVNNPTVSPVIGEALLDLPVVSVVSDIDNFFSESMHPDSGGIYMYTGAPDGPTRNLKYHLGGGWIRPASVEYFNSTDGTLDFQANCGVKIHGGASRTPTKTAKHSFKLGFKSEFGPSKLKQKIFGDGMPDQYDWLILRGGFATRYGLQLYDPFTKTTMRDMGNYAAHSRFVHVYLNGMYWGIYNLSERMDDNFMRDHFGGNAEDYDIIKDYFEIESGDTIAWSNLVAMTQEDMSKNDNYQRLLGNNPDGTPNAAFEKMISAESLIDYMLLNFYLGNTDWDHHNWLAYRSKVNSDGFSFLPWDSEYVLRDINDNSTGVDNENRPSGIFRDLMESDIFSDLFIEHVNQHFFGGGALTPAKGFDRYDEWKHVIDTAIICESARWNESDGTKPDIWEASYHTFIEDYFPLRTEVVFKQLINRNMYPFIYPPEFNAESGEIPENFELLITAPKGGDILYTLDGTDPGYHDEEMLGSVFMYDGNPLTLSEDTLHIKARVKSDTLWSILVSEEFIISDPAFITPNLSENRASYFISYPNPATNTCSLKFSFPEASEIDLKIYDVMGSYLLSLEEGLMEPGEHVIQWNTGDIPPGIYFGILEDKGNNTLYRTKIIKK